MSDTSVPRDTLRVTVCDTDETLAAASRLFNQYRHHYGEPPEGDERTLGWLTEMVQSKMLTVYTASVDSPAGALRSAWRPAIRSLHLWAWDGSGSCATFTCSPGPVAKERQSLWSAQSARRHSRQAQRDCHLRRNRTTKPRSASIGD